MSDGSDGDPEADGNRPTDENRPADENRPGGTGSADSRADGDPFESLPEAGDGDPFERLDDGAAPGERTPAEVGDLFEPVEVGATGGDASWEELVSGGTVDRGPAAEVDPTAVEETVVPKRRYCQDCEYLTAPPELACTHADGEILEVVDTDRFRVRNCPVVAHRRERSIYEDAGLEADD